MSAVAKMERLHNPCDRSAVDLVDILERVVKMFESKCLDLLNTREDQDSGCECYWPESFVSVSIDSLKIT